MHWRGYLGGSLNSLSKSRAEADQGLVCFRMGLKEMEVMLHNNEK